MMMMMLSLVITVTSFMSSNGINYALVCSRYLDNKSNLHNSVQPLCNEVLDVSFDVQTSKVTRGCIENFYFVRKQFRMKLNQIESREHNHSTYDLLVGTVRTHKTCIMWLLYHLRCNCCNVTYVPFY